MAKKKQDSRKIALMLILIAVVWGAVFFQIFFKDKNNAVVSDSLMSPQNKTAVKFEKEKYKLNGKYVDPFLGEVRTRKKTVVQKKKTKKKTTKQVDTEKELFEKRTSYKGIITDEASKTAYIVFKEATRLMQVGDSLENFRLQQIEGDSVLFIQAKKQVWIKK